MSVPIQEQAPSRRDQRVAADLDPAAEAVIGQDRAVEFLTSLAPPSNAERTRAFAALLRALTAEPVR